MSRVAKVLGLAGVVGVGLVVALDNAGRRVDFGLGLVTFGDIPVALVAFGGMIVGMAVVLVAGISADLRVRRLLSQGVARGEEGSSGSSSQTESDLSLPGGTS